MKRIAAFSLALIMCLILCACGVEKQTVEINYGEEYTVELKKQQDGIEWDTENSDIISVNDGTITAIAPGSAVVNATKNGKSVAEISVSVNLVDIAALLFSQKTIELEVEETVQLHYVLMPENASDYGLSWKSANPQVAEVDEQGNILGVSPGVATVVCSTPKGVLDTCEVTVKAPSAIEQLNEYEKRLFDFMIDKFLPSFYNAPAVRIRKIETYFGKEDFEETMMLGVNIQGTNRLGGTLNKDYMIMCMKDESQSMYLPCVTESGLFDRSNGDTLTPCTKLDPAKINAALEEYWDGNIHN